MARTLAAVAKSLRFAGMARGRRGRDRRRGGFGLGRREVGRRGGRISVTFLGGCWLGVGVGVSGWVSGRGWWWMRCLACAQRAA